MLWKIVQWPIALFFVVFCFALIYFFAPDIKHAKWYWITPGSVIGVLLFAVQMAWHVRTVRRRTDFRLVDDQDKPRLCRIVEPLAIAAGLPTPYVAVIDSPALNAFACGIRQKDAVLVFTRGLIDGLNDDELAAVAAHEIVHIVNGDIRLIAATNVCLDTLKLLQPRRSTRPAKRFWEVCSLPILAVVLPMMCHRDEQTAIERGIDGAHFFGFSLAYYYAFGEHRPGHSNVWREFTERRDEVGFARQIVTPDDAPLGVRLLQQGLGSLRGAIGTPEQISDLMDRYQAAGVDQVIFVSQAGTNRHEHICESLELFAAEVMPRFTERATERERDKRERLAGAIERALARRPPPRAADPDYVVKADGEPAPAQAIAASAGGDGGAPARASARELAARAGEAGLAALVRNRSDAQLHRMFDRGPGLSVIFKGMERAFLPERSKGFEGEVEYELRGRDGPRSWTVRIGDGRAEAHRGPASDPAVTLRTSVPDFVRMAAREAFPPKLLLEGALVIEGDFALAGRLGEMFGAEPPT